MKNGQISLPKLGNLGSNGEIADRPSVDLLVLSLPYNHLLRVRKDSSLMSMIKFEKEESLKYTSGKLSG